MKAHLVVNWFTTNIDATFQCSCGAVVHYPKSSEVIIMYCHNCDAVFELPTAIRLRRVKLPLPVPVGFQ